MLGDFFVSLKVIVAGQRPQSLSQLLKMETSSRISYFLDVTQTDAIKFPTPTMVRNLKIDSKTMLHNIKRFYTFPLLSEGAIRQLTPLVRHEMGPLGEDQIFQIQNVAVGADVRAAAIGKAALVALHVFLASDTRHFGLSIIVGFPHVKLAKNFSEGGIAVHLVANFHFFRLVLRRSQQRAVQNWKEIEADNDQARNLVQQH